MTATYPKWKATRSNEDFDRAQALASRLTQQDRDNSAPAPQFGYSQERFNEASAIVRQAAKQ